MRQRIDLDAGLGLGLEKLDRLAAAGLKAFAPGDPAVKLGQGAFQRRYFAQSAASIGVKLMQGVVGIVEADIGFRRADDAQIAQIKAFGQLALIGQRFGKQHPRVDKQHRRLRRKDRDQMQQNH